MIDLWAVAISSSTSISRRRNIRTHYRKCSQYDTRVYRMTASFHAPAQPCLNHIALAVGTRPREDSEQGCRTPSGLASGLFIIAIILAACGLGLGGIVSSGRSRTDCCRSQRTKVRKDAGRRRTTELMRNHTRPVLPANTSTWTSELRP